MIGKNLKNDRAVDQLHILGEYFNDLKVLKFAQLRLFVYAAKVSQNHLLTSKLWRKVNYKFCSLGLFNTAARSHSSRALRIASENRAS